MQLLCKIFASCVGSLLCIVIANPIDVIKTRVQSQDFGVKISGIQVTKDVLSKEGPRAFYKGFVPKAIIVAPKLVFAFTTLSFSNWFDRQLSLKK